MITFVRHCIRAEPPTWSSGASPNRDPLFKGRCHEGGVLLRGRYSLQGQRLRLGYAVREAGETDRILVGAIVERFTRRADGELVPLTEESTRPVAETRTDAGIVRVKHYIATKRDE